MAALRRYFAGVSRAEAMLLAAAMALALACVVVYVLANRYHPLVGDMPEYDLQARLFTEGMWWWSTTPFGVEHATAWKAPLYPLWLGFWYELLGPNATRVEIVQAFGAPLTVMLSWLLARRLFTPRVALAAAFVVAVFPLAWEFYGLLYPEALAVPLTMLAVLLFLGRDATPRAAALAGAAVGVCLLVRPTSGFLLAGVAAAWIVAAGWRRGIAMSALSVLVAALVVAPWTVRNFVVLDGFVPISVQDAAAYGTFNETSATDPVYPYQWRSHVLVESGVVERAGGSEVEFRARLQDLALDYIAENPESLPKAFFWNGLSRLWDVRRPARAMTEVDFEGRSAAVTGVGLAMYYVLLPLAIVALWRLRRRRELVVPLVAMAIAASLVFTVVSGTRYRAPLEPVIAILACSVIAAAPARRPAGSITERA
jgi:4-amino-4-deoxy-L-arabinose transferase-like glycosyltransferase